MDRPGQDKGVRRRTAPAMRPGVNDIISVAAPKASAPHKKEETKIKLPSKRKTDLVEDHELQTTPEFRSFVGKKLSEIIDSSIKIKENINQQPEMARDLPDDHEGIKLFTSSRTINKLVDPTLVPQRRPQKKVSKPAMSSDSSSDSEADAALASVAVDGEMILAHSGLDYCSHPGTTSATDGQPGESLNHTNDGAKDLNHEQSNSGDSIDNTSAKKKKQKKKKKSKMKDQDSA